jgi:hypothetical protein
LSSKQLSCSSHFFSITWVVFCSGRLQIEASLSRKLLDSSIVIARNASHHSPIAICGNVEGQIKRNKESKQLSCSSRSLLCNLGYVLHWTAVERSIIITASLQLPFCILISFTAISKRSCGDMPRHFKWQIEHHPQMWAGNCRFLTKEQCPCCCHASAWQHRGRDIVHKDVKWIVSVTSRNVTVTITKVGLIQKVFEKRTGRTEIVQKAPHQ